MPIDTYDNDIITNVSVALGFISFFCSIATLGIIHKLCSQRRWKGTGCLFLIGAVALTQIPFDIAFMLSLGNPSEASQFTLCQTQGALLLFGGLASGFWTNTISISMLYIVVTLKCLSIVKMMPYYAVIACGVPLAMLIWGLVTTSFVYNEAGQCFLTQSTQQIYATYSNLHRLIFIINICVYFITVSRVLYTRHQISGVQSNVTENTVRRSTMESIGTVNSIALTKSARRGGKAIFALCSRLCLYPLLQAIIEIFRSWDRNDFNRSPADTDKFWPHLLHVWTTAAEGIGYFLIFLVMQPRALLLVSSVLCDLQCSLCWSQHNENDLSISSRKNLGAGTSAGTGKGHGHGQGDMFSQSTRPSGDALSIDTGSSTRSNITNPLLKSAMYTSGSGSTPSGRRSDGLRSELRFQLNEDEQTEDATIRDMDEDELARTIQDNAESSESDEMLPKQSSVELSSSGGKQGLASMFPSIRKWISSPRASASSFSAAEEAQHNLQQHGSSLSKTSSLADVAEDFGFDINDHTTGAVDKPNHHNADLESH